MSEHLGAKADAYLDSQLDAAGCREVKKHLEACMTCADELKAIKAVSKHVADTRPAAPAKNTFNDYWQRLLGRHQEVKTMTAIQRLKRVVESNIHSAIDAMEEPSKMIKQLLREMDSAIQQARDETVQAMVLEKGLKHRYQEATESAKKWEDRATLALKNKRDDLAREALQEQLSLEGLVEDLRGESEKQTARVGDLKRSFQTLDRQYADLKRRQALWLSNVQQTLGRTRSRQAYQTAYKDLERILITTHEQTLIETVYHDVAATESLEQTIDTMDQNEVLEKRLSVLKQRLQP